MLSSECKYPDISEESVYESLGKPQESKVVPSIDKFVKFDSIGWQGDWEIGLLQNMRAHGSLLSLLSSLPLRVFQVRSRFLSPIQSPFFPAAALLRIPRGQHPESELPPNLDHFLAANFKIGPRLQCCTRKASSTMQFGGWHIGKNVSDLSNKMQNDFSFALVKFISMDPGMDQLGHNSPTRIFVLLPSLSAFLLDAPL